MLKKIILDYAIPAVAIGIIVVAGIFIAQELGVLRFDSAQRDNLPRTVDTPEYKALDSAYREQEKQVQYWYGYSKGLEEFYNTIENQKQQTIIKYKNEIKRIENNTADNNFDELRGIIRSRQK